jgi:manganese/iron transport system permease protein
MSVLGLFLPVLAAALIAGLSCGFLGVFVIGMRIPFMAVCTAHTALAGAVAAHLLDLPQKPGAFAGAVLGAALLWKLAGRRSLDPNAALGALFSLSMGIAFLGIGLIEGPRTEVLSLLWGNVLFTAPGDLPVLLGVLVLLLLFIAVFHRDLKLLLFDRELASILGRGDLVFGLLLVLSAGVISVNLDLVGGLLLYSLISNPAIAALRIARRFGTALAWSAALGAGSALVGFALAAWLDLPVGACIVLVSSLPAAAALFRENAPAFSKPTGERTP